MSDRPSIVCTSHHTGLPVPDVEAAVEFYTGRLGFESGFTWGEPVSFAGVDLGECRIFLSEGTPNPDGCTLYFMIEDADALYRFHQSQGVEAVWAPEDQEYGLRDYGVRDLHGYQLVFGHPIYTVGPPVRVERVDRTVRLEARLAALVDDLAAHKGMTVGNLLEEILLHTCEPLGDGVASPHTRTQLRFIQDLKEKHGIDYDCEASYRFMETDDA